MSFNYLRSLHAEILICEHYRDVQTTAGMENMFCVNASNPVRVVPKII